MSQWFKRIRNEEAGITLIELIVVVAIIGVLAWLITPRVLATLNDSKVNSAESVANEVHSSLERYAAQNTQYPAALATWTSVGSTLDVSVSNNTKILDTTTWSYSRSAVDVFCAHFTAKDKDNTTFKIEKTGVTKGATCTP